MSELLRHFPGWRALLVTPTVPTVFQALGVEFQGRIRPEITAAWW